MQPIRSQILCKPFPSDDVTEGWLFVPESVRKTSNKVKVIAVGNGTKDRPMKLQPGDVGYRVQSWGLEIMIDGELHVVMDQDAILAKEN